MTISRDVQKLELDQLIELFEVDGSILGADTLRFHGHTQLGSIWWQGIEYSPWPIAAEGFARVTDQPPSPKLSVANIDGSISLLCLQFDDMVGARVVRRRTFGKYLDARNFFGPDLAPAATWKNQGKSANHFSVLADGGVRSTKTSGSAFRTYKPLPLEEGKTYEVSVDVENDTDATMTVRTFVSTGSTVGQVIIGSVPAKTSLAVKATFVATETAAAIGGECNGALDMQSFTMRNLIVREMVGNEQADPLQELPVETWFIERKSAEHRTQVEFELASVLDFNGVQLPRRMIVANQCSWEYRGADCGYLGPPVATLLDEPTDSVALDRCGKRLRSCKLRFGEDAELPYGGFPAAGLVRT